MNQFLSFLEEKPSRFGKALHTVFANRINCEDDAFSFIEEISDLMEEKQKNGGIVLVEDIYELWEDDTLILGSAYDEHHIKPKNRGGKKKVSLPEKFHREWHIAFADLYKKKEIIIFLEKVFKERLDSFSEINKSIKYAKREAKRLEKAGIS